MNRIVKHYRSSRDNIFIFYSLVMATVAMLIFTLTLTIPLILTDRTDVNKKNGIQDSWIGDISAPVIIGAKNITVYKGESVAYRKNITLEDDSGSENVTLTIDSSKVDTEKAGIYAAIYTATDMSGKKTSITVFVTVIEPEYSLEIINTAFDNVISTIISDGMSKEDKCRTVYEYVKGHISYVSLSDKKDWRAEAYRALFVTGTGDCFSFFAAAKMFFERLGIENLDIQRTPDLITETHYWSLVNIGDDTLPKWYHFDATRLRAEYNHSGCLLTEVQVDAYSKVRQHFYTYDKTSYPSASIVIITPTPEIEEYYNN